MWKILARSVEGTSHKKTETHCQDFCDFRETVIGGTPCLIAAIADGAGSALCSRYGAEKAVLSVIDRISSSQNPPEQFDKSEAITWFDFCKKALQDLASERGCEFKELSCTLLVACVTERFACFAQIGDGAWVVSVDGKLQAATWPSTGEYANETVFLTSKNCNEQIKFAILNERIEALSGFTDGLQLLALDYSTQLPHEGFFTPLFDSLKNSNEIDDLKVPLYSFLDSELVNNRTDDDKTLIIAVRA